MCFVNDCEWYASVIEHSTYCQPKPMRCFECRRQIRAFEPIHRIFQREHEECYRCFGASEEVCSCPIREGGGLDWSGEPLRNCCQCPEPDYGESFETWACQDCHDFLEAVKAAEIEAGCDASESQPPYEEMIGYLSEGGAAEAKKYYQKAAEMFPRLVENGYLKWLWREIFGN